MSNSLHSGSILGRSVLSPTLFAVLKADLQDRLLSDAPLRSFGDGQLIQQRGEDADGFWVIEQGAVQVGLFQAMGSFRAIAQLVPGDSYGELAVLAENKRAVDAIAMGPAQLRWISAQRYRRALADDPENVRTLISALAMELQELIGVLASARLGGAVARISGLLLNLAGSEFGTRTIEINQQQLGELLGLTRASINKGLSEIEAAGAIKRGYGKIQIINGSALARLAQG